LTKPGIVLWLVITAYVAMVVAERGLPGVPTTVVTLGGLALSAGGAHAVNMWFDRDIDAVMARTQHRPVASGRIMPRAALVFGIVLGMISLGGMLRWGNAPSALATAAGYLYYVLVYTIWLKRRSPQNIVIGGVAGAVPPLVGWLAVSPHWAWPPVWMFVIITLWTPPHFWALAIARADDYGRAHAARCSGDASNHTIQHVVYGAALGRLDRPRHNWGGRPRVCVDGRRSGSRLFGVAGRPVAPPR
jgi:protoheme IX farnesyltransferase